MWNTYQATVENIFIAKNQHSFVSEPITQAELEYGGIPGDLHFGMTKFSGSREPMYPRNTKIFNRRQITIVSIEECAEIAKILEVDRILPEWLGANIAISGYPELTKLPEGSRIIFPSGAGLVCEGENQPCVQPGEIIQEMYPEKPKLAAKFVKAAHRKRGIICVVECIGEIIENDQLKIISYNPPK